MSSEKINELESELAELKARWPRHSAKPWMWQRLEELEESLEQARREEADNG
jgi:hypothetical protein